jgi:hypothetical protein
MRGWRSYRKAEAKQLAMSHWHSSGFDYGPEQYTLNWSGALSDTVSDPHKYAIMRKTLAPPYGSISKWNRIATHQGVDEGIDNCHLCTTYQREYDCGFCPVRIETGVEGCLEGPYDNWATHHMLSHSQYFPHANECPECTKIALQEVKFLKSLLPIVRKSARRF